MNLFYCVMKNKKTLLIILLLVLVTGGFLYKTLAPSASDNEFGPLAYFEKEGNLSCVLGSDFNSSFLTEEDQVTVSLSLDDSLIMTYKNVQKKTSITLPKGLLTLGAHQLKITSKHATRGISEDERVLYVLSDITPASWSLVCRTPCC